MWKFCKYCGNPLDEKSKFCTKCGKENNTISNQNVDNKQETNFNDNLESRNKTMAIIGFVCSLIGFFFAGLPLGLVSISLGASVLKHNKVFNQNKGQGLAKAGIIIGTIDIVLTIISIFAAVLRVV